MWLNNNFRWKSFGTLLLYLTPAVSFCGIQEVPGLNIQKIAAQLSHHSQVASPPSSKYLDELLAPCAFRGVHLGYAVETYLQEGDANHSEDDSEMTNTDLESIEIGKKPDDKREENPGEKFSLFALNCKPGKNDSKREYLLRESDIDTAKGSFTKNLCTKLVRDACHIAHADKNSFTRNATTCLCVVLRDEYGNAKKFVFHNGKEKMGTTMAKKAQALRYGIRTGLQSHAEGEFVQFLLQRDRQNEERYTHILGMGCSRMHCRECDALFQLFLGKGYHGLTAAAKNEESSLPVITDTEVGCVIRSEINAPFVYEREAVSQSSSRSQKYYLPRVLRHHISKKAGFTIHLSADRFIIKDEETMEKNRQSSDKKRKASM